MILQLKSVLSNPFRDLKTNPLIEEKIAGLMDSINLTGFWENVVVRKNADSRYELAYGHHRLEAAIRAGITEADFIVKNFDDAKMIQVMDNENRETYGSTPQSIIESVKAVVQALAKGNIPAFELDPKVKKESIRYAPSYAPGESCNSELHHPYTAYSIAKFLGRTQARKVAEGEKPSEFADKFIVAALDALFLKEKGRFSDSMLKKKDQTGATVPITMSELRERTSTIKKDYARVEIRTEEAKKAAKEFDAEQRSIQAARKAEEEKAEAERQKLVKQLAAAKKEEDDKRALEIKERLAEKEKEDAKRDEEFVVKNLALEVKLEENKKREAEAKKEDEYLPIRREVERILHKLEGSTATTKEALAEEIKGLTRKSLTLRDRDRLREEAQKMGDWYSGWVADQLLPPLSVQKTLANYRSRAESERRAKEAKAVEKAAKKEKAK